MSLRISRRRAMQVAGAAALAPPFPRVMEAAAARTWPILEGPDTPKLCLGSGDGGGPLTVQALQNLLAREQANPGAAVTPPVAGAPSIPVQA